MEESTVTADPIAIPAEILELVSYAGPSSQSTVTALSISEYVATVRLRSYWARLADLALGRTNEAERWLGAYHWAVEQESKM